MRINELLCSRCICSAVCNDSICTNTTWRSVVVWGLDVRSFDTHLSAFILFLHLIKLIVVVLRCDVMCLHRVIQKLSHSSWCSKVELSRKTDLKNSPHGIITVYYVNVLIFVQPDIQNCIILSRESSQSILSLVKILEIDLPRECFIGKAVLRSNILSDPRYGSHH